MNKNTRTLTATLTSTTNSRALSFSVAGIKNPTYAQTTAAIAITAHNSTSSSPEVSDTSFKITPTPGALTVALTSENDIAGSRVS